MTIINSDFTNTNAWSLHLDNNIANIKTQAIASDKKMRVICIIDYDNNKVWFSGDYR